MYMLKECILCDVSPPNVSFFFLPKIKCFVSIIHSITLYIYKLWRFLKKKINLDGDFYVITV
jgi:hypothetical protein